MENVEENFLFVAFPIIVIGNVNAFVMVDGTEMDPPAYVPYDHLRIRTKVKEPSNIP